MIESVARKDHPLVPFLYYVGGFILLSFEQHPVFLFMDVCVLLIHMLYLDRGLYIRKWGVFILLAASIFLVINPLFNHRGTHVLFFFAQNPIMLESVIRGLMMALTLIGFFLLIALFNSIITSDRFLFLFSKWLPQWALLTMLSMRFVPLFRWRLQEIETIQTIKGLSVRSGSMKHRVRSGVLLVQILLTWSLEDAIGTADSMVARGYGLKNRSQYRVVRFRPNDWIRLSFLAVLLGLNGLGCGLGYSVLSLSPILETSVVHGEEWLYLGLNFLYFSWPLWRELKEGLYWQFSKVRH